MKKYNELTITEQTDIYSNRHSREFLVPIKKLGMPNIPYYDYIFSNEVLLNIIDHIRQCSNDDNGLSMIFIHSYEAGATFLFRKVDDDQCCVTISFEDFDPDYFY